MFGWFKGGRQQGRSQRPLMPPQPPAAKDWGAGDVARCVTDDAGGWVNENWTSAAGPRRGQILRVTRVYADPESVWLCFAAFPGNSYPAGYFRKLRTCTTDFREQLRQTVKDSPRVPELVP